MKAKYLIKQVNIDLFGSTNTDKQTTKACDLGVNYDQKNN